MEPSTKVAYVTIEATDLLRICFAELKSQPDYQTRSELMLRGTLPRNVLEKIEADTVLLDPKGLRNRFTAQRRIYIDSWSELVTLGSLTQFFEAQKNSPHYVACVGIETTYKESKLREKFLSDGAIASRKVGGRQLIQSCLAQNIKCKSARKNLQDEIITRLEDKLRKAPSEPAQILAVTVMSETQGVDDLDFSEIAQQIADYRESQTTYEKVFCIIPGFSTQGAPQVAIVMLWPWPPDKPRVIAVVDVDKEDVEFVLSPS